MAEMKPEELAALQQQCIFCHIASGKVASRKVYEDDQVVAVLDINPANPGHILLVTKKHYFVMPQVPDEETAYIGKIAKGLSHSVIKGLKAQGTSVFVANGAIAGQRAQHFMMHIIPRMEGDNLKLDFTEQQMAEKDLEQVRKALQKGVNKVFRLKDEEPEDEPEETVQEAEIIENPEKTQKKTAKKTKKKNSVKKATKKKAVKKKAKKKTGGKEDPIKSLDDVSRFLTGQ